MSKLKTFGRVLLLILECIGYLFFVISFMWIFFDIFDGKKGKL